MSAPALNRNPCAWRHFVNCWTGHGRAPTAEGGDQRTITYVVIDDGFAYYAALIAQAEREGRLKILPTNPRYPCIPAETSGSPILQRSGSPRSFIAIRGSSITMKPPASASITT